jgi:hypothetical protein
MSLTKFVKRPDVRHRLRQFPKPRLASDVDVLFPPQSPRCSLVGTAFDYLLRFYIQRHNPKAKTRPWVAEAGLSALLDRVPLLYDVDSGKLSADDGTWIRGKKMLERASAAHQRYLASGSVTNVLLESVIGLAQLDVVHRAGFVDPNLGIAHRADVLDLRRLISAIDLERFRTAKTCFLNPSFGMGSQLIGGADADLILDGMLIDVKVTKNLALKREYVDQLLGYLLMNEAWGVNDLKLRPRITKLAIYFARHAYLHVIDVEDVVPRDRLPSLVAWFKAEVERPHAGRLAARRRVRPDAPSRRWRAGPTR